MRVWKRFGSWGVSMPWWLAVFFLLIYAAGWLLIMAYLIPVFIIVKLAGLFTAKRR